MYIIFGNTHFISNGGSGFHIHMFNVHDFEFCQINFTFGLPKSNPIFIKNGNRSN